MFTLNKTYIGTIEEFYKGYRDFVSDYKIDFCKRGTFFDNVFEKGITKERGDNS